MITLEQFSALAQDYTVIPLEREILADHETPISVLHRLEKEGRCFLLESVEGGERWGRFSILGFGIDRQIVVEDGQARLEEPAGTRELPGNPIDAIQAYLASFQPAPSDTMPRFCGGAVGYLSFECVRFFERCGEVQPGDGRFPDATFVLADQLAIFDNVSHSMRLICCVHPGRHDSLEEAYEAGTRTLAEMATTVTSHVAAEAAAVPANSHVTLQANMPRETYEGIVQRAKQYIQDGDIIQVVLAQHFSGACDASPLTIYRALRYVNPSPYMYFLKLDEERAVVGSSPEVLVRVTGDEAEIRPIAGTRPRGQTTSEDQQLQDELLADPKERAEHVMLVDLARNDLGRVAVVGSVEVTDYMYVENYSHVMHLVSTVRARLREGFDAIDVLKASFPAGTLSGAPKVRAMEIIAELEPCARGPYGGALGYISYGGNNMDLAITIRTVVCDGNKATVTAGAGIVFDSVPETEYYETIHKSNGMRRALELATHGLEVAP